MLLFCFYFQPLLAQIETKYSVGDVFMSDVYLLRPTQMHVGMEAVNDRMERIAPLERDERHEYLQERPVPVVIGPGGEFYMIDRHHMSLALVMSGHRKIYVRIVKNWSKSSKRDFWKKMERAGYAYLRDEDLNKIGPKDLPADVTELKDDPYRALAAHARERGAFKKSLLPFAEFRWAAFYRDHISPEELSRDWESSLDRAIDISSYEDAKALPGYIKPRTCRQLFK